MQTIATLASTTLLNLLSGDNGVLASAAQITADNPALGVTVSAVPVINSSISIDLAERSPVAYPSVQVFCEKLSNTQREKFRSFSGKAHLVIEVRSSSDQVQPTEQTLQVYTHSALQVLHANRGDWGSGMFYGGMYDVSFAPIRRGGSNYLQVARISLALDICID